MLGYEVGVNAQVLRIPKTIVTISMKKMDNAIGVTAAPVDWL